MERTRGEGLADIAVRFIRFTSDFLPLPRDATRAGASNIWAEDVSLC